jgi:N-hydroxyarylamine O-acetyltransferase
MLDVSAYLERIRYAGPMAPTLETLRAMHRAHAYTVPFENLDIALGVPIQVDGAVNFEKIVRRRRGGFCLELTGLFGRVLREMGFSVDVIGAQVTMEGVAGHPMAHMILIVRLDEPWIADVGFGGRVIEPLPLRHGAAHAVDGRGYTVSRDSDLWRVTCDEAGYPAGGYIFQERPSEFHEFHAVCGWLQTSPDSRFTHGSMVSLARPDGRTTLAGGRLIRMDDGVRSERDVALSQEPGVLEAEFGIALDK